MNPYRRRVLDIIRTLLQPYAPVERCLDFGPHRVRRIVDSCATIPHAA